ncbi:MAG: hypothetical protein H7X89_15145 [Rhizobiales bacterium]|nr:hypothetical protein [Hyphomicrobiales bacterium]
MFSRPMLAFFLIAVVPASVAAQERLWSLDAGDEDAYLVFGVPETDDVGISFWCTMGTDEIGIFVPEVDSAIKPGKTVPFTMTAGETVARFEGKTTANEMSGTSSLEAKVSAGEPFFEALKEADRFKVKVGNEENVYPLIDADVSGLLALCRKP